MSILLGKLKICQFNSGAPSVVAYTISPGPFIEHYRDSLLKIAEYLSDLDIEVSNVPEPHVSIAFITEPPNDQKKKILEKELEKAPNYPISFKVVELMVTSSVIAIKLETQGKGLSFFQEIYNNNSN